MAKSGKKRGVAGSQGFGKTSSVPTRDATRFMKAARQAIEEAKGDKKKVYRFFKANLDELDESLLEALPSVFAKVTSNERRGKREKITGLICNFGNLISQFPLGDRAVNLELAIKAHQLALRVFFREESPENWATTQSNLGAAYSDRIRGERAENLEKAIAAYELALEVRTREAFPEYWATTQHNLGAAYSDRIRGERAENLEQAIAAYELALEVRTREAFPEYWATTQNNLGAAYSDRIRGERAENLEKAIAAYELALEVRTREAFPEYWATTQHNLGAAYSDRIRGERAENLEQAIAAYELALEVRTREAFPEYWATTQNNLGAAYSDRIRGERAENLEKAIAAYELALEVRTREALPEYWATTQNNLGNAYSDRIRGERAENLEKAIAAYELALEVRTREALPEYWATTQNNLGNAYSDRVGGVLERNLEESIRLHNQAAEVFTLEAFPDKWAENQTRLAESLMKQASLLGAFSDLDSAIALLQDALEVATPNSPHFIDSQHQLGNALSRRYENSQNPQDLEQALQAYRIALDAISPEHYDRRQIWQALPTTQSILGSRLIRDGEWQEGLQLLLNSVSQLSVGDDHLAHAGALFETGRAHDALSDWENARLYFRDALRLYIHLNDPLGVAKSRAELGGVLVSQGYTKKGLGELSTARDAYRQLKLFKQAKRVDSLYQVAQQVLEKQTAGTYV